MREAEPLCTKNIGLKDIAQSRRGGTNNVLHSQRAWVPTEVPSSWLLPNQVPNSDWLFGQQQLIMLYLQVAILWYPAAAFGSWTPPIFGCQTRNLSATNQQ